MRGRWVLGGALLGVCCLGAQGASPQEIGLWLDPRGVDLTAAGVQQQLLEAGVDYYVLPWLLGGQTLLASRRSPFRQMVRYRQREEVIEGWVKQAQARGRRVLGYVDCWQWGDEQTPAEENVLRGHPEWSEKDAQGRESCQLSAPAGYYASGFHPQVRAAVCGVLQELGERYPQWSGVILCSRLPLGVRLGFHEKGRVAYIRSSGVDPIDLKREEWEAWQRWRLARSTEWLTELVGAYRGVASRGRVGVRGWAWLYERPLSVRDGVEDWMVWLQKGLVEEVWLEGEGRDCEVCRQMLGKLGKEGSLGVWLPVSGGKLGLEKRWESYAVQGAKRVLLVVRDALDMQEGLRAVSRWRRPAGVATAADYREDKRLQVEVSGQWVQPRLRELLAELSQRTGVRLSWGGKEEEAEKPLAVTWGFMRAPVWKVMEQVASWEGLRGGRWEEADGGYRLRGEVVQVASLPSREGAGGEEPGAGLSQKLLGWALGLLGLLAVLWGLAVGWRRWRRGK